jgi:hypothetical protein
VWLKNQGKYPLKDLWRKIQQHEFSILSWLIAADSAVIDFGIYGAGCVLRDC